MKRDDEDRIEKSDRFEEKKEEDLPLRFAFQALREADRSVWMDLVLDSCCVLFWMLFSETFISPGSNLPYPPFS